MKKRLLTLLFLIALTAGLALRASADMGPKPSVVLEFSGLEGQRYAAALLGDTDGYGPWSAEAPYAEWMGDRAVWEAFRAYEAPEGWYFWGKFEDCTETQRFAWTYYPPQRFYILLYFPDTGEYRCSPQPYERYAFDSVFAVEPGGGWDVQDGAAEWRVRADYDYTGELFSLACRIAATIAVEMGVAWAFGLYGSRCWKIVWRTNIATQVLLNVGLNLLVYYNGYLAFVLLYFWLELLVFGVEGAVYRRLFPRQTPAGRRVRPWLYALAANAASAAAGAVLARYLPGLF